MYHRNCILIYIWWKSPPFYLTKIQQRKVFIELLKKTWWNSIFPCFQLWISWFEYPFRIQNKLYSFLIECLCLDIWSLSYMSGHMLWRSYSKYDEETFNTNVVCINYNSYAGRCNKNHRWLAYRGFIPKCNRNAVWWIPQSKRLGLIDSLWFYGHWIEGIYVN